MRTLDIAVLLAAGGAVVGAAWWRFHVPTATPPPVDWQCIAANQTTRWDCFVSIPGGTFILGAQSKDKTAPGYDPDAAPNEGPARKVTVSPFWIQRNELSVGLYRDCVRANACSVDEVLTTGGYTSWYPLDQRDSPTISSRPLNGVSWAGADAVCRFVGGRLPTEAEWEFAAKGTDGRRWTWGNTNHCPAPRKSDPFSRGASLGDECIQDGPYSMSDIPDPGPFNTLGMAGNLWEWVGDWYDPDWHPDDGAKDPIGPASGVSRAQRGGSWTATSTLDVRTTVRGGLAPESKLNDVGLRCVFGGADVE